MEWRQGPVPKLGYATLLGEPVAASDTGKGGLASSLCGEDDRPAAVTWALGCGKSNVRREGLEDQQPAKGRKGSSPLLSLAFPSSG